MMILNAGKNEMFGRGSLSFESVIRGREKFFFLILLSSNFDAKSHATARSIFFSTGDSVPTPPVDFRDVIRLASCEYTVVSTTTAGATILQSNRDPLGRKCMFQQIVGSCTTCTTSAKESQICDSLPAHPCCKILRSASSLANRQLPRTISPSRSEALGHPPEFRL
jgi:hypothetical protein